METNTKLSKCTQCVYAVNNHHCGLRGYTSRFNRNYCSAQNTDRLPNGFELQDDGYFSWVNKEPKYPTTYDDCCKVLGISYRAQLSYTNPDVERGNIYLTKEKHLLDAFMKLRICRNAYWKIAGEEMGLNKPWEPDWKSGEQKKYCIYCGAGIIQKGSWCNHNSILAFPTEEMRDVFHDNFKDLIEQCKEFL